MTDFLNAVYLVLQQQSMAAPQLWSGLTMETKDYKEAIDIVNIPISRWVGRSVYGVWCYECENCHAPKPTLSSDNYCPNCGFYMKGN